MGVLASFELRELGIPLALLHPGMMKTEMTQKYSDEYEAAGAVPPDYAALRVLHEANKLSLATSGKFINVEDGLEIPW